MSSKRETAPTVHGEVEYETVECASCGERVAKKNASRFVIGDLYSGREIRRRPGKYTRIHFEHGPNMGWACDYCKDDPIRFPRGTKFKALASVRALFTVTLFVIGVYLL